MSWRLIYIRTGGTGALFGKGEQVKLFCKTQLMKDHCCPEENGGNCIIYALQLQPRRHKQSNLHKTRQRRLQQSQQLQLRFPVSQTRTLIISLLCERDMSIRERSESPHFSSPRQHCVHCWDEPPRRNYFYSVCVCHSQIMHWVVFPSLPPIFLFYDHMTSPPRVSDSTH